MNTPDPLFAKLRRHAALSMSAAVLLVVIFSGLLALVMVYRSFWWIGPVKSPMVLTVAAGCPKALGHYDGVQPWGFDARFEMVPKNPVSALVCWFNPGFPDPVEASPLNAGDAERLAGAADAASTNRIFFNTTACAFVVRTIIVIAFHYRARGDVDVWLTQDCGGGLTNGVLQSTNPSAFEAVVERLPAPALGLAGG